MQLNNRGQTLIEALLVGLPFLILMSWFIVSLLKLNVDLLAEFNSYNQ